MTCKQQWDMGELPRQPFRGGQFIWHGPLLQTLQCVCVHLFSSKSGVGWFTFGVPSQESTLQSMGGTFGGSWSEAYSPKVAEDNPLDLDLRIC